MDNLNLDLNEPIKSSEYTGSSEPSSNPIIKEVVLQVNETLNADEVEAEKRKVVQLSNDSILHGYDLAVQLLTLAGHTEAANLLTVQRATIQLGLDNSISKRIEGNIG